MARALPTHPALRGREAKHKHETQHKESSKPEHRPGEAAAPLLLLAAGAVFHVRSHLLLVMQRSRSAAPSPVLQLVGFHSF